jgi:hypothetical protein
MLIPKYKELWKPYEGDGCSLEMMIAWGRNKSGAPDEVMSAGVRNLFFELSEGKKFSTDGCGCGCGMTNTHSAINHYFLKQLLELKTDMARRYWQVLEDMQKANIIKHIEVENEKYIKKKMTPWYKKLFGGGK